ncbi:hypothetical protein BJX66DRAFT_343191 [Aspergillus keveii]|uniref:Integral membrane protein 25D9-6 n=1 Tax=Aspergillus keveii TaxID=714993 RepID=A0ABR4FQR8_9EURO
MALKGQSNAFSWARSGTAQSLYTAYLQELQRNPLRTRMLTAGFLSATQELTASYLANDVTKSGHYFSPRVLKMLIHGLFISAPLSHTLSRLLQRAFAGRTSLPAKILQIFASNLIVSPIQNTVYLASMSVIAGARTWTQIRAMINAGFLPMMKVSWATSPVALAVAQKFLPEHAWAPFFNLIGFFIGTYINTYTKKRRLEMAKRLETSDEPREHR